MFVSVLAVEVELQSVAYQNLVASAGSFQDSGGGNLVGISENEILELRTYIDRHGIVPSIGEAGEK